MQGSDFCDNCKRKTPIGSGAETFWGADKSPWLCVFCAKAAKKAIKSALFIRREEEK